jgi:ATP-binding cassette subfamily G (WHITE) protein 2 (SNQ2)
MDGVFSVLRFSAVRLTWIPAQNFGIVLAFAVGFITLLLVFTELNTSSSTDTSVVLFKRGSKRAAALVDGAAPADEEKASPAGDDLTQVEQEEVEAALAAAPPMTDVFSWQNLNYVVPVKDGTRKLLDNVSGYVVPGKLTALMCVFMPMVLSCDAYLYYLCAGVNPGPGRRRC